MLTYKPLIFFHVEMSNRNVRVFLELIIRVPFPYPTEYIRTREHSIAILYILSVVFPNCCDHRSSWYFVTINAIASFSNDERQERIGFILIFFRFWRLYVIQIMPMSLFHLLPYDVYFAFIVKIIFFKRIFIIHKLFFAFLYQKLIQPFHNVILFFFHGFQLY